MSLTIRNIEKSSGGTYRRRRRDGLGPAREGGVNGKLARGWETLEKAVVGSLALGGYGGTEALGYVGSGSDKRADGRIYMRRRRCFLAGRAWGLERLCLNIAGF